MGPDLQFAAGKWGEIVCSPVITGRCLFEEQHRQAAMWNSIGPETWVSKATAVGKKWNPSGIGARCKEVSVRTASNLVLAKGRLNHDALVTAVYRPREASVVMPSPKSGEMG